MFQRLGIENTVQPEKIKGDSMEEVTESGPVFPRFAQILLWGALLSQAGGFFLGYIMEKPHESMFLLFLISFVLHLPSPEASVMTG